MNYNDRDAIYENAFITSTRFFLFLKINFRVFLQNILRDRLLRAPPQLTWIARRDKLWKTDPWPETHNWRGFAWMLFIHACSANCWIYARSSI
jgi:hypothetical protein